VPGLGVATHHGLVTDRALGRTASQTSSTFLQSSFVPATLKMQSMPFCSHQPSPRGRRIMAVARKVMRVLGQGRRMCRTRRRRCGRTPMPLGVLLERRNRTLKAATVRRYHYDSHGQLRQLR
jgi:hypothetical protein